MSDPRTNESTWRDVLDAHFESFFQKYHAPIQGLVNRYDSATQLADVQTVVKLTIEGLEQTVAPIITDVSVAFPGGRDHSHTWPLYPGDGMTLIPQDADVGGYLASGSVYQQPHSARRFSLSDAIGFPLVARPQGAVLPASALASDGAVLSGKTYIGSGLATLVGALDTDQVVKGALDPLYLWMTQVEVVINGVAPGSVAPLSTTFSKVGNVQGSATKLVAE